MSISDESFDLSQKAQTLSTIISLDNGNEPEVTLQHIKEALENLVFFSITESEEVFKHVIPVIRKTIEHIYSKNNMLVQSNSDGQVLTVVKNNFQITLDFIGISNQVLGHVMAPSSVAFNEIQSVPVNIANIICSTFEHCKYCHKTFNYFYKSVSEIVDLFRRTQELHTKFLNFLDRNLVFDFLNENETSAYKEILEIILEISKTLSGINMKSMADNWKTFIALIQKQTPETILSLAIKLLTEEIEANLQSISESDDNDSGKILHFFKISGFLVKVVLKLLECEFDILESFYEILRFWIMIYSWRGCIFQTSKFSDEVIEAYNAIVTLCSETLLSFLPHYQIFLKKFCSFNENICQILKEEYGCLVFASVLIKEPNCYKELNDTEALSILQFILNLTKKCYVEFYFDNENFYDELVTNISIAILIFPNIYPQVENLLLECVVQENIWTALIAVDVWCFILRHSSERTCRSVLTALIDKILQLNVNVINQFPAVVFLKILIQRIFTILPVDLQIEELTKYDPNKISIWKIINTRNIPLSHRYYLEFILSDFDDKMCSVSKENYTITDFMYLIESFDTLSYTNFNHLEINITRIVPTLLNLWSFDLFEVSPKDKCLTCFVSNLLKITTVVAQDLTGENLIFILGQLKPMLSDSLCLLLVCEFLGPISCRNFNNFLERNTLFSLIIEIFLILLSSKNAIVVQMALETFIATSENGNFASVIQKVSTSSAFVKKLVSDYIKQSATETKFDLKYFELIRNNKFQHFCVDLTNSDMPKTKRIKIESDASVDQIIDCLKRDTEKLFKTELNSRQLVDVKSVILKLEMLCD